MVWNKIKYSGWGCALHADAEMARPERHSALLRLMGDTPAPAVGQRRSYGDAALNDGRFGRSRGPDR